MTVNPQHDPVQVAVSEAENALDTALSLLNDAVDAVQKGVDSGAVVVKSTAGGAEADLDKVLSDSVSHLEAALKGVTTLAHITQPSS